jgi:small conductance mechanosensitive channel
MTMQELWNRIQPWVIDWGLRVAGALLLLIAGLFAARTLARLLRRILLRVRVEPTWTAVLARAAYIALLVLVLLIAFGTLGVDTTSLIALLGAAGLTVALAWQGSLSHLASGLMIVGLRLFRVGDQIEVLGVSGRVEDIQLFHTILTDTNQVRLILPNGKVTDNVIRNHSWYALRRVERTVTLGARTDVAAAKEALRQALAADPRIKPDPPPEVEISEWTADTVTLVVRAWVPADSYPSISTDLPERIRRFLEERGVSVTSLK